MLPEMTPELQAYLDARFARIEDSLDELDRAIGVIAQSLREIGQAVSVKDSIDNLTNTLNQRQAARRRR
jgi:uncharacterized protein YdcH (DUF465 family)